MSVKARIAAIQHLEKGDNVGYGLRYQAPGARKVAVIPIGYGDGYPRVRNKGEVLIQGKHVPIVGANAMDSTMIDITKVPDVQLWDEVVLMGEQGGQEISVHELVAWKKTVSYEVLTAWRFRLPRVYVGSMSSD